MGTYGGGGFIAELGASETSAKDVLSNLKKDLWIDDYTRVVFIEFVLYNANVNLFGISSIAIEFSESGGKSLSFLTNYILKL